MLLRVAEGSSEAPEVLADPLPRESPAAGPVGSTRQEAVAVVGENAPCKGIFNQNFKAQIQSKHTKQVLPQLYLIAVLNPLPQPVAQGSREHGGVGAGFLSSSAVLA